jgi:TRAP-type C4-dicarboxylate transport system substrate-binding protein
VKKVLFILLALVLALSLGIVGCTAPAEQEEEEEEEPEVITLTYGSLYGSEHTFSKADTEWMDKIVADTDGQVEFDVYWGATLISREESCTELIAGVADVAYIGPGYSAAGYDIDKGILAFSYGVPGYDARRFIFETIWDEFPEYRAEFADMKIMCSSVSSTYQLLTNTPVRTLDDLSGLRIKATGSFIDMINALGGEGISLPMGDVYTALQKNDIQGALVPYSTIQAFSFYEVADYMTILDLTSACRPARAMNLDAYNSLPADIQQIFDDSREYWEERDDYYRDSEDVDGRELGEQEGMEFIELSAEDLNTVYEALDPIMRDVAAGLDDKGLPGTEIYERIRELVDEEAWEA